MLNIIKTSKTLFSALMLCIALPLSALAEAQKNSSSEENTNPRAVISTTQGDITLELYPTKAPVTVKNFIAYANSGFYSDTIFHRVIKDFMIQGGGFTKEMTKKSTQAPIVNESFNGVSNREYTIAMARTNNPDSATAQFFINTKDNPNLNAMGDRPGYAVFGRVINGKHVVDEIENSQTKRVAYYSDVPVQQVVIKKVVISK